MATTTAELDWMTKKRRKITTKQGRRGEGRRDPVSHRNAKPDEGTKQLQAVRERLVNLGRLPPPEGDRDRPADPALSAYPLGIMLARRLITQEMHNVGASYARLFALVVRRPTVTAIALEGLAGKSGGVGEFDEEREERREAAFAAMRATLMDEGRRVRDAVDNLVVYGDLHGRFPRYLDTWSQRPESARRADARELEAAQAGLRALVRRFG